MNHTKNNTNSESLKIDTGTRMAMGNSFASQSGYVAPSIAVGLMISSAIRRLFNFRRETS